MTIPQTRTKSLAKGLLAGLIGGIVATAAKTFAERIYPPRTHGESEPAHLLPEKTSGHEHTVLSSDALRWGFGAATGAVYGAIAEYYPEVTSNDGANFGMTMAALTQEGTLPALGLVANPAEQTASEKSSEIASHVVYGVVTETVRKLVRTLMR